MQSIPVMLKIDEVREKHIFDELSRLSKERRISEEVGKAVREYYNNTSGSGSDIALEYFKSANQKIINMHQKVDMIYKMCIEMYTLNKFKARKVPNDRVKAVECAGFMLERQISSLCDNLGIRDVLVFNSNKTAKTQKVAEDALEYIIENFEAHVNELVAMAQPVAVGSAVQEQQRNVQVVPVEKENVPECKGEECKEVIKEESVDDNFATGESAKFLDDLIGGDDDF